MSNIDPWHYPRPDLAQKLLSRFDPGPAEALSLYAPRREGKSSFLLNDLATTGASQGLQPVFVDLWANRERPGEAIADALEAAARKVQSPDFKYGTVLGRFAKDVTSIGAFGVSVGMKERPSPTGPATQDTLSRIGYWADQLVAHSARPVLLIIDEAGALANAVGGQEVAASLRAALQRHGRLDCRAVFSASSRESLTRLFDTPDSPLYRFGISETLPPPDAGIAAHFAERMKASSGIRVSAAELASAYEKLGQKPAPLRSMAASMDAEANPDVHKFLQRQLGSQESMAEQRSAILKKQLAPVDLALLREIASGRPQLWGADALGRIADEIGVPIVTPKVLDESLAKLRAGGLIARVERGQYELEDHDAAHALLSEDVLEPRMFAAANATMPMNKQNGYVTIMVDTRGAAFEDAGRAYELARVLGDAAAKVRETHALDQVLAKLEDLNGNRVGRIEWQETVPLVDPTETGVMHLSVRAGDTTAEIIDEIADNVRLGATSFVVRSPDGSVISVASLRDPEPEADKRWVREILDGYRESLELQLRDAGYTIQLGQPGERLLLPPASGCDKGDLAAEWERIEREPRATERRYAIEDFRQLSGTTKLVLTTDSAKEASEYLHAPDAEFRRVVDKTSGVTVALIGGDRSQLKETPEFQRAKENEGRNASHVHEM